jgi:UDP-glucose 4-epimerase
VRVLLTGAAGLIGRMSARLLDEGGHEVLSTDLHRMPVGFEHLPWRRLDVRRGAQVRAALEEFRADAVVHLAARHFIPWCERFPAATLQTNVVGSQNVIEGVCQSGTAKLVFASSASVYGPSLDPLPESFALGPDDVYGASKAAGEQLLRLAQQRKEGLDAVVLRLFNTIGPGDPNPHLIPRLVRELHGDGGRLRLGNLDSVRDYVYVEDVARAILAAVEQELPGFTVLNVGAGAGRSVNEVVSTLGVLVGRPLEVLSTAARRRAVDRPFLVADRARARRLLGWEPAVSFEEGLARTLRAGGVRLAQTGVGAPAGVGVPTGELVAV